MKTQRMVLVKGTVRDVLVPFFFFFSPVRSSMNQTEKIVDRRRERLSPEPGRVFHRTGRHLAQTARHSGEAGAPLHSTPQAPFRSVTPRPPPKSRGSHQSLPVRFKLSRFGRQLFSVRSTTSSVRSISTEPGNKKKRYQDLTKPNHLQK